MLNNTDIILSSLHLPTENANTALKQHKGK